MSEKNFNVKNISKVVWKNVFIILITTIIIGLGGNLYAKHKQHTTYESVRNIMTSRAYDGANANEELQADINLGNTYAKIIESNDTAAAARKYLSKDLQKKYNAEQISSMVNAEPIMQTTIVRVSAKANTSHDSAAVVNAVAEAAAKKIPQRVTSANKISLFSKAVADEAKSDSSPSIKKLTLLGAAVGFLLGFILSFSATTWVYLKAKK
ncbi:Wzz/FepE/Etk N-terminal domain-containing protein [Limosilactobacillus reuteri]|uniref:Wzz/FepE/Etk N-terminal domain-containing protein n=1 Tax=Limosilactobacillus reuteri TaxID=1598 RepID=UPI0023605639|nr:Wzz/FepE/Etk N-terminal domain-containing protein [Limosilactobacillus reuteri]MDD1401414.1 Wzz/FepE/Etk N-terminal domain-containing protein [Limosilactobacillus reuteri]